MRVEFKVLGDMTACCAGGFLPLGQPRQRAVLATLLATPNQVVPISELVGRRGDPPRPASSIETLYCYVSMLRRLLQADRPPRARDQVLRREPPGYLLRVEPEQLDALLFERAVAAGQRLFDLGEFAAASERLVGALGLWHGSPYPEFGQYPLCAKATARLDELHLGALEARWEAELRLGRNLDLVAGELSALGHRYPARQRLNRLLMQALYRTGYQAEALMVFERTRLALDGAPDAQSQRLFLAILRQEDATTCAR